MRTPAFTMQRTANVVLKSIWSASASITPAVRLIIRRINHAHKFGDASPYWLAMTDYVLSISHSMIY